MDLYSTKHRLRRCEKKLELVMWQIFTQTHIHKETQAVVTSQKDDKSLPY
jgi:hypothetical protein